MPAPNSFRDPVYAGLAAQAESKLGLPVGLLSSIITNGERSNADQVSSAGARTVAQIIPATRKAVLDKYGIDAYLSPENAIESAGLLLKEGLDRNNGDIEAAVREYHGGTDRANWGKVNDAYAGRVLSGQQVAKSNALENDFSRWMKANPPATITPAATTPVAASGDADPLDAGFTQFLAAKQSGEEPGQIPGRAPGYESGHGPIDAPQSLADKLIGSGEAALNVVTGATGGALGLLGGAIGTGAAQLATHLQGLPDAPADPTRPGSALEQGAVDGAQMLTYQPRTAAGRDQSAAVGQAISAALPIMPLTGELQGIARASAPIARAIADQTRSDVAGAAQIFKSGSDAVAQRLGKAPQQATPTPGTMGSAGAAATDIATQRVARAQDLPVPVQLTKGQATRDQLQQTFERETAKGEGGAPLRERFADQNQQIQQNIDSFIDSTGAEAPTLRAAGVTVDDAVNQAATRDKAQIRAAYKEAEKAGEMESPVSLDTLVDHLNESAPEAETAPILKTARALAVKLGIATENDGALIPADVPLATAERFRQVLNRATGAEPTNIRQSAIMKGLVDDSTQTAGGVKYAQARQLRARFAQNYQNHSVISDILASKKGTTDRKIALEDIHKRAILDGSLDDVRQVRRVLQRSGEQGHQAWRELQGQTLAHIREQAIGNASRDVRGNPIVSAAKLDRAIKSLDADGKLDFIFGRRGAQQLRDLRDLAFDVFTAPPGSVNTSNSASVILAALDIAVSGTAGIPLPIASGVRMITSRIKDRQLAKRVNDALATPHTVH